MEQIPRPAVQRPTDVILKVSLAAICGTDVHFLEMPIPDITMGHEAVGEIVDMGEAVRGYQKGDRVVMSCMLSCGKCQSCLRGDPSACIGPGGKVQHGLFMHGCQAEYVRVPHAPNSICKVPDALTDEQAILTGDIFSTGMGVLERVPIRTGDTVAIFALGPLGLCAVKAARILGAGKVIGVDPDPFRRETAQKMGANVTIDPGEGDPVKKIMGQTDGFGVDIAVEAVGLPETLKAAFKSARIGGAVSSVGVYGFATQELPIPLLSGSPVPDAFYHRKFFTTLCPSGHFRLKRLLGLMEYGKLDFSPMWTHSFPLEEAIEGYETFRDRSNKAIKIGLKT
jgi:threonine dehydrogenase-like Zn-dependent dehydrogenase